MSVVPERHAAQMTAGERQPLITVAVEHDGVGEILYFTDETEADATMRPDFSTERIKLAGVWSDLNWEEAEAEFERIRHESKPTPPIDSLER